MAAEYLSSLFGLQGRTAIITGATGGLGSALALALVQAGCSRIVSIELPADPQSAALKQQVEAAGAALMTFTCDLRDTRSVRACFADIWAAGVQADVLVNCAGVMRRNLCMDATDEELDLLVDVNLKSYYVATQEFGRRLLGSTPPRPGKVVNIASVTAFNAGFNTSVYSTTKGGVLQMTKAFSNEWASKGIQVNCIAPGFMRTSMTAQYQDDAKMTEYLMMRVPSGRWGEPADLVSALLFLCAPGNAFTSGACVVVDGGFCGK